MDYSREKIEQLAGRFGLPLNIFDEKGFTENYKELNDAMKSAYGNYQISYSFKTNYVPSICKTAKNLGAYAEVVSGMEYSLAKRIGYEDRYIIFNGPYKGEEGIQAFLNRCIVNADNLDELEEYCQASEMNPDTSFELGLRVNLDIGQGFVSRFGMDEEDIEKAFCRVSKTDNLKIVGLHCHISRCRGKEAWKKRTEYMLELSDRFFDFPPKYIDLGSGMFGSMAPEFAVQFDDVPTYQDYAEVTSGLVAAHYQGKKEPLLFTEPGTTLVNRFIECISRVDSIKKVGQHYFAVLNASIYNLGETCTLKKLPIKVISGGNSQTYYKAIDLTGYTCLEQDIMYSGYQGDLAKGDFIIFCNTGGYSTVLKPPFIRPDCAMVVGKNNGEYKIIKASESCEDVFQNYTF